MTNSLATVASALRIPDEAFTRQREMLDLVAQCGDEQEFFNSVVPIVQQYGIPPALQERIVTDAKAKLHFWGNRMGVATLRALLFPPPLPRTEDAMPSWAKSYCFVSTQDEFFNTLKCEFVSVRGFDLVHARDMPFNGNNKRLKASEHCMERWGMPIVERVGYRPDCGPIYEWDGVKYANRYSPTSLPDVAATYSEAGLAGIRAFYAMLYDMSGRRDEVFNSLLYWFAHNVQRPGVKIRWSPIMKGVHGDGKTLACTVLRAAMGYRNVNTTSNPNISNSGGFTDWAVRGAVNIIEEIMLTGKQRHQLYNAMKEFITNNVVDINPKGAKPYQTWNCTNHIALTNHNDAIPLEKTDRRWFVIYTPWSSLAEMMAYCGLDAAGWKARTDAIDNAIKNCAGELRAWLLSIPIPEEFDISGSALMTPEKRRMLSSSKDESESAAEGIIATGAVGITESVISSAHLSRLLAQRAQAGGFDAPKTTAINHMLTRLGYSKVERQISWGGIMQTVWLKDGVELTNDEIRRELDSSQAGAALEPPPLPRP